MRLTKGPTARRPIQAPSFQKVQARLGRQLQLAEVRSYEASILRKAGVLPAAQLR